ncbi:MAG: polysaccharide biosynthesis tyrosine autokinase [Leptolyngbyaceae cyanobacterium bins.59]|nr:polysaccharide biosynthesis tyrosine autokinase [Leptolyngbyaceae cyanobacterium bins.59]
MQIKPYQPLQPGQPQPQPLPLSYYSQSGYEPEEFDLRQILGIFRRRVWVIAGVAIAVTGAIWSWTLTRTPIYQSGFQVQVEPVTTLNKSEVILFGTPSTFDYATQIEVLRSPQLIGPIIQKIQKTFPDYSGGELAGGLTIRQIMDGEGRPTKILAVEYRDRNPQKVKEVLDRVAEAYVQYSIELRQTSLQQGVQFVESQLPSLTKRVSQLQADVEKFRQRYSVIDPESRGTSLANQLAGNEQAQNDLSAELSQQKALYNVLSRQVGARPEEAIVSTALSEASRYQSLLSKLREIETQIALESTRFQPDSPNIQALISRRNSLLPLMEQEAQRAIGGRPQASNANLPPISLDLSKQLITTANQIEGLQVRLQALTRIEQQLKNQFSLVPSLARQYTDLQRELVLATESLNRFLETRENLQLEAAQRALPWQLLTLPGLPQVPVSPNIPRNLTVGVVAGLLLGIGAALLAEKLDNVFHSANDLKDKTRLPLLGIIPYSRGLREISASVIGQFASPSRTEQVTLPESENPLLDMDVEQRLSGPVTNYQASPFLDSFRSLYTNIRFLSSDEPIRSLVVGSAVPADGKSTVAAYLAQAAAAMGQRVLLVDADLRRPQVHVTLGLPNLRGLSNIISSDVNFTDVMQTSPLDENLSIITAGQIPPDPTKLLASKKMHNLVEHLQSQFDLVIYDTPPLLGLADSSLLASRTSGIVLVVGLGRTDRSALMQALDGLRVSAVTILGIVANGVENYASSDYYKAYYRRYYMEKVADQTTA